MEGKPRCKKCGRVLKSPASIARGMGPKCAGITCAGKSLHVKVKPSSGMVYQGIGVGDQKLPLITGELSETPLSKREIFRTKQEERRRSFETHQSFQCGFLMPKQKPLIYTPLADGNWMENTSGRVISHERLQSYLRRYRFI